MISTRLEWDKSGIPSFSLESLRKYFDQYLVATCSYKFSHHVKGDHSFIHTEDLLFKKASTMPNLQNDADLRRLQEEIRRERERVERLERELRERQQREREERERNRG